jgi:hypothetical protein
MDPERPADERDLNADDVDNPQAETTAPRACITILKKAGDQPLSKRIELRDGQVVSDASLCWMNDGFAKTVECANASALANIINSLPSHKALALGIIKGLEIDEVVRVASKRRLREYPDPDAKTRTKDNIVFVEGKEGWVLLDYDQKGMFDTVHALLASAGGFIGALALELDIDRYERVLRSSTSAGLYNMATKMQYRGSGGEHLYVLVVDSSDIPRFIKVLAKRLWLRGLGWIAISTRGSMLVRTIVDAAVGLPERLAFEGAPILISR